MQIDRAMSLLLAGYPIRRASWIGREDADCKILDRAIMPSEHGFYFSGKRTLYGREQEFSGTLVLSSADLQADDWEPAEASLAAAEAQMRAAARFLGRYVSGSAQDRETLITIIEKSRAALAHVTTPRAETEDAK